MSKQASLAVKYLMSKSSVKRAAVAAALGVAGAQTVSDKLSRGRWSADELARIGSLCGMRLAYVDSSGQIVIPIDPEQDLEPPPGQ